MNVQAAYWEKKEDGRIHCLLCPRGCIIPQGSRGYCLGRVHEEGSLWARSYGRVTSLGMDPIEKKPLYHFAPGSFILSAGTYGCNLHCMFCQNCSISRTAPPEVMTREVTPEQMVEQAGAHASIGIAYTYNEPSIWFEYVRDTGKLAKEAGLANILVTNGWICPDPLEELLPLIHAANIDIKAFNERFYPELTGGDLDDVLRTAKRMREAGVHVETTTLIIPNWNDSMKELSEMGRWIRENLGEDTPVHISSYRPSYRMTEPPTPLETIREAWRTFREHLPYVYMGNVLTDEGSDTVCKSCGSVLINRSGYRVSLEGVDEDLKCAGCGADNSLVPFKTG